MVSTENRRVRQLLEDFVAALTPTDHEPTLDELRGCCDQWMTTNVPAPPELLTEQVDARGVSCLWASMPGTSTKRTILYLHGGAYVVGSAVGWSGFAAALSQAADARVLLIDFRLAPENPHPAALDDALTAYRWLVETTSPQAHTVVAGESAGGGLTLALLDRAARRRRRPTGRGRADFALGRYDPVRRLPRRPRRSRPVHISGPGSK